MSASDSSSVLVVFLLYLTGFYATLERERGVLIWWPLDGNRIWREGETETGVSGGDG